jgi:hypothetical protein
LLSSSSPHRVLIYFRPLPLTPVLFHCHILSIQAVSESRNQFWLFCLWIVTLNMFFFHAQEFDRPETYKINGSGLGFGCIITPGFTPKPFLGQRTNSNLK